MVPAAPPEVYAAAALDAEFIFSFEQSFYSVWSVKLSKFVLLVKFVPLEGLCYLCFHVPFFALCFLVPSLCAMVLPLRYARAMTQQGRGELKARRGKSPRGAVLEGSP